MTGDDYFFLALELGAIFKSLDGYTVLKVSLRLILDGELYMRIGGIVDPCLV